MSASHSPVVVFLNCRRQRSLLAEQRSLYRLQLVAARGVQPAISGHVDVRHRVRRERQRHSGAGLQLRNVGHQAGPEDGPRRDLGRAQEEAEESESDRRRRGRLRQLRDRPRRRVVRLQAPQVRQLLEEDQRPGQVRAGLLRAGEGQFVQMHGVRQGLHSHQQLLPALHDLAQAGRQDVLVSGLLQGFHQEGQHAGPPQNHTQTKHELVP